MIRSMMLSCLLCLNIFVLDAKAEHFFPVEYSGETTEAWLSSLSDEMFSVQNKITGDLENLKRLEANLLARIKSDPENPYLYALRGRVKHGFLSSRVKEIRHLGREFLLSDEIYIQLKNETRDNYQKALLLDDQGYEHQLSGKILAIIDGDFISNSDMKIKALRKQLNRPWGESEYFEYSTYSHIVTAYMDEKRYDEALSVIDEIAAKFPSMQSEIDAGRQRIQNYQQTATTEPEQNAPPVKVPEKATPPTTVAKVEPAKVIPQPSEPQITLARQEPTDTPRGPRLIGLVLVLLIGGGWMKRRQS